ncbi:MULTISPECIES: ABC transporter substrate-binding protein [Fusobacterium]|uniref:ABC transporter substrate-binding protein n=1 Tax=Fusobacterium TaxID=848 RepID=UPI001F454787|nr:MULTISPECIES: ABC transporter substrate-binding protein [Fusobacterium]MCF2613004.1 ABC transporter substrate-binding protein [Fusobacterium perfoetens]MDY2980866.1 ABC transporter substrate-binding protein [Fusobacterium sp.]
MKLRKLSMLLLGMALSVGTYAKENIVFWHAMTGEGQKALEKIVDDYNKSQDEVVVDAIFQGSYEESIVKFKAVSGTKEVPDLVQMNDVSTSFMYRSGAVVPMYEFIKEDKNFDESKLEDVLLNYYRINGKLYSMPFNSSTAILVYNKDAFREVGLDPEKAPKSYKEIEEYSRKLVKTNKNGVVDRYGFSIISYAWFIEQLLANDNSLYVDEENGRNGKLPTKVVYGKQLPVILDWMRRMNTEKLATNYGREWNTTRSAFNSGKVAMFLDSSAGITGVIKNSNFEVGTAFIPNESGEFNGSIIGGASLWITKSENKAKQKAAWDFVKYATSKDVQAFWSSKTGYFPVNKESYDTDLMKVTMEKMPQFKTIVEELEATNKNTATQGAILGVFPDVREKMVEAMEAVSEGKDSKKEAQNVEKASNRIISRYNRINK